jgi:hypothetical protein
VSQLERILGQGKNVFLSQKTILFSSLSRCFLVSTEKGFCQAELENPFEIESEVWTNAHSNCFPQIVLNSLKILLPKLFLVASSIKFSFFVSFHSKIVTKT